MELKIYYNAKFQSGSASRKFVRICIADPNAKWVFGSMCGTKTEKPQRFSIGDYNYTKHIDGINRSATECIEDIFCNLTEEEKECLSNASFDLNRSFRAYVLEVSKRGINYDYDSQKEFYSVIQGIREKISCLKSGSLACECGKQDYVEMKECDGELLDKIISSVFSCEGSVVEVEGKKYCLKEDVVTKTKKIYEVHVGCVAKSTDDVVEISDDVKKPKVKVEKMAFMKDDKNLLNFNKDELYKIVEFDGDYVRLIDVFGEKRFVNSNRVEIIEVEQEFVYE